MSATRVDAETAGGIRRAPSTAEVSRRTKLAYAAELLRDHRDRYRRPDSFDWLFEDLAEYDELLRRHASIPLASARAFEVGYGARPYRLIALQSMAAREPAMQASGVDMEVPILQGRVTEWWRALRTNGAERLAKSLVRHTLFDRAERARFDRALRHRGITPRPDLGAFIVSDAAALKLHRRSLDLVISEDVFEHIPRASLDGLCSRIAEWLEPSGLALIRPNVYTGITGGHQVEWNRRSFSRAGSSRRTPPWGHLRGRTKPANTYLNALGRADYRRLFRRHFTILEERVKLPELGREYLVDEVAAELAGWSEEELFSNQVLFVLRPREGAPGSSTTSRS
jgi:Methyltransferase domain